jgi:hypothetical protein
LGLAAVVQSEHRDGISSGHRSGRGSAAGNGEHEAVPPNDEHEPSSFSVCQAGIVRLALDLRHCLTDSQLGVPAIEHI